MKRPDRKIMLGMALSLAAGAMIGPAKLAHPRDDLVIAGKHQQLERVMLALKKLFGPGRS